MTRRILVLTSDGPLGEVLQDRLQEMDCEALACTAQQAVERTAKWGRPDLVVWDLPSGETPLPGVPLIALLAADAAQGPAGAAATLGRPVDFEDLAGAVEAVLDTLPDARGKHAEDLLDMRPFPAEIVRAEQGRRLKLERMAVRVSRLGPVSCWLDVPADFRPGGKITLWLPLPGKGGKDEKTRSLRLATEIVEVRRQGLRATVICRFPKPDPEEARELRHLLAAHRKT